MKVIQVATLFTPDGAYGGPGRVAVNQTRALRAAGHEVELVAGASGFGKILPEEFDGVSVKLFPARALPKLGFSGTFSPALQRWLKSNLPKYDVAHIHMGRDMVTLPTALLARNLATRYVLQTHGMVTPSSHPLAGIVDKKWTIPALKAAEKVLYLTTEEHDELNKVVFLGSSLERLTNGVPEAKFVLPASDINGTREVLFLARLHERKRPLMFVELAKKLAPLFPNVRFVMVGPDGGEGQAVRRAIASSGITRALIWEGSLTPERTADRISRCAVYVLPSVNEPFPMSVLEALSLGKPCVVTRSCGLAEPIQSAGAGAVVDESLEALASATSRLLSDEAYRRQIGTNALALADSVFSMQEIVKRLEQLYEGGARQDA